MSDSLRLLTKNERMSELLVFLSKVLICSFFRKQRVICSENRCILWAACSTMGFILFSEVLYIQITLIIMPLVSSKIFNSIQFKKTLLIIMIIVLHVRIQTYISLFKRYSNNTKRKKIEKATTFTQINSHNTWRFLSLFRT